MSNLLLEVKGFYVFDRFVAWYGVLIALGMVAGLLVAIFIAKKKGYDSEMPINLALFAIPLAIVGARLYYCIFKGVDSFAQIFQIHNGGMAIYGGIIGGYLGVLLCCKIKKYSISQACDVAVVALALGQAIGRIGCYLSGCCYGIETTIESFMVFPLSTIQDDGLYHYATFFYESFFNLLIFIFLFILTFKTEKQGLVTGSYLITYGIVRAVLEQFRDPSESLMLGNSSGRVSQILSIILIIRGIITLVMVYKKNKSDIKSKEAKIK